MEDFKREKAQVEQQIRDIIKPFVRKYDLKSVDFIVSEKRVRDPIGGGMITLIDIDLEAIF